MASQPLIVPIQLVTGSLHFAELASEDGTAQDVIDKLSADEEVRREVLGDVEGEEWALQRIREERSGRPWEEDELVGLGDGLVDNHARISTILASSSSSTKPPPDAPTSRHFSAFPLTSHLHTPVLRLVSVHPTLSLKFAFLRVPEIHDGFEYKVFIGRNSLVKEVVGVVLRELGLVRSLPVPGGGSISYVMEEVWVEEDMEKSTRLPETSNMHNIIVSPFCPDPFRTPTARRFFRFCVPDEWYRRASSRRVSLSMEPSEGTLKALQEEDEEDEGEDEGTAKVAGQIRGSDPPPSTPPATSTVNGQERFGSVTSSRLSSMFDGWLRSSSPTPSSPNRNNAIRIANTNNRLSVSEPRLVEQNTGSSILSAEAQESSDDDDFDSEFEHMLDDLGLKGEKRKGMYALPLDRKRHLLQAHRQKNGSPSSPRHSTAAHRQSLSHAASYGPASATNLIPRLVPQLTGDAGIMRRFSLTSWGSPSGAAQPVVSSESNRTSGEFSHGPMVSPQGKSKAQMTKVVEDAQPLQPQTTGSLWSSWWTSSGGDKPAPVNEKETAQYYITPLRSNKPPDQKVVKHLISLRVHLSTAKFAFIEDFVIQEKGLEALAALLARLVGKGGKKKSLSDVEATVLLEVIKCLRVLLNTEPGFQEVLASPVVIAHISYSLYASSTKVQTLASELLAAICFLSVNEGHKAVLAAMSDFRIAFDEAFRFETLIATLRLPELTNASDAESDGENVYGSERDGVWEARTSAMTLINALTNCPESLEERIMLREEFGRRGLNEIIVALRYVKPPDALLTQLDVYTEEKFEDEEDMRDRVREMMEQRSKGHERARSDSEVALQELIQLAKQHGELYPLMVEILRHYGEILQKDVGLQTKADMFLVLDQFVEQAAMLDNLGESWHGFLKRFAASVQHITGQELSIDDASNGVSSHLVEEVESLRNKVEELSDERTRLREQLEQQLAEINTLKSLGPNVSPAPKRAPAKGGNEPQQNFHGVVQRLVQKEKQVIQLQTELDRYRAQNPSEDKEAEERAKRERDRAKWNALMEEIAKLKTRAVEVESDINTKDKEIIYLKRALESVYTRFLSREEAPFNAEG
ncbi:hypothetical protein NP233_g11996 [Leucocoprinus birnbaumii]|uniref:GBD/FH3 domain-containing protein n=1 Tax=Leucocoprinus birnbaumii TaxID=56174 RepID=A0AAD5YNF7_9AGAR|nr:hypothetical protein NP233_g11996 [Leucocoprinus birnbaumii]